MVPFYFKKINMKICKTPESIYHIDILSSKHQINVNIDLPNTAKFPITEGEAIQLENAIHDAMEKVLESMFNKEHHSHQVI